VPEEEPGCGQRRKPGFLLVKRSGLQSTEGTGNLAAGKGQQSGKQQEPAHGKVPWILENDEQREKQ
jgi:hypothetical protein